MLLNSQLSQDSTKSAIFLIHKYVYIIIIIIITGQLG